MVMSKIKQPITLLVVCIPFFGIFAQKLTLKKGIIIDSLKVRESLPETYALYLPKDFELKERWPLLVTQRLLPMLFHLWIATLSVRQLRIN